jgi:hypothetical protein
MNLVSQRDGVTSLRYEAWDEDRGFSYGGESDAEEFAPGQRDDQGDGAFRIPVVQYIFGQWPARVKIHPWLKPKKKQIRALSQESGKIASRKA